MTSEWFVIDSNGRRPVGFGPEGFDFWEKFNQAAGDGSWPAFTQLVVDGAVDAVHGAIDAAAAEVGLTCDDVTDFPELWAQCTYIAHWNAWAVVGEPMTDLDERFVGATTSELIVQHIGCTGAYFGYDPAGHTLHLTIFEDGVQKLAWCDSLRPGPSFALTFDDDGNCTYEDPRQYALRVLGMPETSPLLDRFAFVEGQLRKLGIDFIQPDMEELPVARVLRLLQALEEAESP